MHDGAGQPRRRRHVQRVLDRRLSAQRCADPDVAGDALTSRGIIKAVAPASILVGLVVTRAVSCGGQIYGNPLGYLDDGGTFHAPDGAVLFGPGSACGNYDPTKFANLVPLPTCDNDTFCEAWSAETLPSGYMPDPKCRDFNGKKFCGGIWSWDPNEMPEPNPIYCTAGPAGDAYCSALLSQFVIGGRADAYCRHQCDVISPEHGGSPYCRSGGPDFYACVAGVAGVDCAGSGRPTSNFELCVERGDAGYGPSEVPCQPPPAIADAGDDQAALNDAGEEP